MRKYSSMLLLAAVLFFATSCLSDNILREEENPIEREESADVVLRVQMPNDFAGQGTRSTLFSFREENYINDIRVLVFDNNPVNNEPGYLIGIRQGRLVQGDTQFIPNPNLVGDTSGEGRFEVTLPASTHPDDRFHLVVIANAGSVVTSRLGNSHSDVPTPDRVYAGTLARLWSEIGEKMFDQVPSSERRIPMFGQTVNAILVEEDASTTVRLYRSIARIDVGVGVPVIPNNNEPYNHVWTGRRRVEPGNPNSAIDNTEAGIIPFRIGCVRVVRANNHFAVAPANGEQPVPVWGTPTVPIAAPGFRSFNYTIASNELDLFRFTAPLDAASQRAGHGAFRRQIYVPEANIETPFNAVAENNIRSGDLNHTRRMALVIGGYFNYPTNSTNRTFYRVDFISNGQLVNVLRNHLYQVNIADVRGPGSGCPQEAYESFAMNMIVEIHEWERVSEEVIFDGINWIRLHHTRNELLSRHAILYDAIGTTDELHFETTIPLNEWNLNPAGALYGLVPDGVTVPLPPTYDYHSYFYDANGVRNTILQIVQNDRFRVELICTGLSAEEATGGRDIHTGYFRFISRMAYDSNPPPPHTATLRVEAGRIVGGSRAIRFPIYITQRDNSPNDWIEGPGTGVCLGDCDCP